MATTSRSLFRRPAVRIAAAVVAAVFVVAVALLEPWNLFIDQRVAEPVPTVAAAPAGPRRPPHRSPCCWPAVS